MGEFWKDILVMLVLGILECNDTSQFEATIMRS
jgi:hypothetical protein